MKKEKVLIVGDFSTEVSFLSTFLNKDQIEVLNRISDHSLLNEKKWSEIKVILIYDENYSVNKDDNCITLFAPLIPKGMEIELTEEFNENQKADVLFFLFSFRFEKHLEYKLKKIAEKLNSDELCPIRIKAVVFDNPDIHTGATDLNNPETELKAMITTINDELKKNHLSKIVDVELYKEPNDFYKLFSGGDRTLSFSTDIIKIQIEDVKREISFFPQDRYAFINYKVNDEYWDSKSQKSITDYYVGRNTSDLIRCYVEAFFNSKTWENLLKMLESEYHNIIKKISFWNINKDWYNISGRIIRKSKEYLMNGRKIIKIPSSISELEYEKIMSEKKYDSEFVGKVNILISKILPQMIVEEMNIRISIFTENSK